MHSENRTIVLLGEVHFLLEHGVHPAQMCERDGKTPVMFVLDYFDMLFSMYPQKKFDLFAEIYPPPANLLSIPYRESHAAEVARSVLLAIPIRYTSCIRRQRSCLFPNVRFHYTDIRDDLPNKELYDILVSYIYRKIDTERAFTLMQLNEFTPEYIRDQILTLPVMQKQLQKTRKDALVTILEDLHQKVKDVNDSTQQKQWLDAMIEIWMGLMDYYLFARLFKPETSNNVIVYAGDKHRRHIQAMLIHLGYTETSHNEGEAEFCVRITPQPGNFFFAPLSEKRPAPGYAELIFALMRPTTNFETSWYVPSYSIQRLVAIYFRNATNISDAYARMQRRELGTSFTFQRVQESIILFVHNTALPTSNPPQISVVMNETRKLVEVEDKTVRVIYVYKNILSRLSPQAEIQLRLLIAHTIDPPVSNVKLLIDINETP